MAAIKGFQCQKRSHTARKCSNREQSYKSEIASYIQARENQEEENKSDEKNKNTPIVLKKVQTSNAND